MRSFSRQNFIPQVSIDCVVFGYRERELKVLVTKLNFKGNFFALPGGFIHQPESIDNAAHRILEERTNISDIYLDQFYVFGQGERTNAADFKRLIELNKEDFGGEKLSAADFDWITRRFISIGYYALVDINKVIPAKTELDELIAWCSIKQLPAMIIDHNEIIEKALSALRLNLDQKLIAFNLLPETFTMKDLQELYEAIFDKPFARNNFQKKMLDLNVLERLEKKFTGAQHKAPYLYRFKSEEINNQSSPDFTATQNN